MNINEARKDILKIAQKIVDEEMDAYEGAMIICKDFIDQLEDPLRIPDDLWPFKSNASAIEDLKWNRDEDNGKQNQELIEQCSRDIIDAAKYLIEQSDHV